MKTIFITGAASGLGKATALLFGQRGWRVLASMRELGADAEFQGNPNIIPLTLDVNDPDQIQQVVTKLTAEHTIDVVFNNAGYILIGPLEGVTEQQLLRQLTTNLLGPIRITQAFLPHFRAQQTGLFLTTTSMSALIPDPFLSVYGALKAGLEQWNLAMNYELNPLGIRLKTIAPGYMRTGMSRSADLAHCEPYKSNFAKILGLLSHPDYAASGSSPEQIADVVYQAATDGTTQLRYLAGNDAQSRAVQLNQVGVEALHQATAQQLFG